MLKPEELSAVAEEKEEENYVFRRYLKTHADSRTLDRQFHVLHKELFSKYDCNACRNCCKEYSATLFEEDIPGCAKQLAMEPEEFKKTYLMLNSEGSYEALNKPCDFLKEDGSCMLGDQKPEDCVDYPFTDRPDRMASLFNIVGNASICPVLYEMLERLKEEYGFVYHRRKRRR